MRLFQCLSLLATALILSSIAATSHAGPTNAEPETLFEIRSQSDNGRMIQIAAQLYAAANEEVVQHEEQLAANGYTKANKRVYERIAATMLKISQVDRMAGRLIDLKEPVGLDLKLRAEDLRTRHYVVIRHYEKLEGTSDLSKLALQSMYSISQSNQRRVPQITALVERGRLEAAETEMDEIYDALRPRTLYQSGPDQQRVFAPYTQLRASIDRQMQEARAKLANEQLAAERAKTVPKYEAIGNLLTASVESVKTTGQANWAGQQLDGPGLIDAWGDGWQKTQVKMLQTYALDRLRETDGAADTEQLLAAHEAFRKLMLNSMADLVSADAGRVTPEEAQLLYVRYLGPIARVCAIAGDETVRETLQQSLNTLAGRSPEFTQEVAAYASATSEALRWRNRMSAAHARTARQEAQSLQALLDAASATDALKSRPARSNPAVNKLTVSAPLLVQDVAAVAVGKPAFADFITPQANNVSTSWLTTYHFLRLPSQQIPTAEVAALKRDLLVAEGAPPLSLEAAIAIETAESGSLSAAGGEVAGVELQGTLIHFIRNEATGHLAVGVTPDLSKTTIAETLWQFDIQPKWLQHEYIFVNLP